MARPTTPPPTITWSKSRDLGVDVDANLLDNCLGLCLPISEGRKVGARKRGWVNDALIVYVTGARVGDTIHKCASIPGTRLGDCGLSRSS